MCLMMPARVLALEPDFAVVEADGRRRRAATLLEPDVRVGDWVLIAGGAVVRTLDPDQAADMAAALDLVLAADPLPVPATPFMTAAATDQD